MLLHTTYNTPTLLPRITAKTLSTFYEEDFTYLAHQKSTEVAYGSIHLHIHIPILLLCQPTTLTLVPIHIANAIGKIPR